MSRLFIVMLNFIILNAIMLNVVILSVIMVNVIILNVIILNYFERHYAECCRTNRFDLGRVFNSTSGCVYAMHLCCSKAKVPNLKLSTLSKQLFWLYPSIYLVKSSIKPFFSIFNNI
jgi:hypothetical protein